MMKLISESADATRTESSSGSAIGRAFFSGFAFRVDRRRPPADSRPEPGAGFTGSVYRSEVVEKLGVPWERGTYSVRALIREKASNVCSCTLGSSGADFRDDPLETYIEERRRNRAATVEPVWPPLPTIRGAITRALEGGVDPFPNYKQRSDSPALPDEDKEGLELSVDRVAELGGGRRCLLRGAFRLHVRPDERVPFDPETGRLVDVGVAGTTAMVLVHLVVTSAGDDGFTEISLRLPTSDPVPPEGGLATGYFNLDLFSLPGFRLVSDTYFISAFSGEHVRGPIPVGIAPRMD